MKVKLRTWQRKGLFLLMPLLFGCIALAQDPDYLPPFDTAFINGKIVTVNASFEIVEALAVRQGIIAALGSTREIVNLVGPNTPVINLKGRTVLPGFYDAHVHLRLGPGPADLNWTSLKSSEELFAAITAQLPKLRPGEWVRGILGFEWTEEDLPDRWDLDRVAKSHPVVLTVGAHTMVVNSLALSMAGISNETPDPPGGKIVRDASGEPTGWLREIAAWRPIWKLVPPSFPPDSEIRENIRRQLRQLLTVGITSANVAGVRPFDMENPYRYMDMPALRWIQDIYTSQETLPRLTVQIRLYPGYEEHADPVNEGSDAAIRELELLGVRTGFGNERLKIGAVKMSIDGGDAGWTTFPYARRPDYFGTVRIPAAAFYRVAKRAHELGWQLGIHAMGNAAVEMAMEAFERILTEHPRPDPRHYLHHVSTAPVPPVLETMAKLGIGVVSLPNFIRFGPLLENLRGEFLQNNNPQQSLLSAGIRLAYGSDSVPYDPLYGIWCAVTRSGPDSTVYGPEERVNLQDAVRIYTAGFAYLNFDEEERGSLEKGKLADLVVLSEDILTVAPQRIREIKVEQTYLGGQLVYSR
ncbi:MAG: amidohydrolase [Acidobacteria bacterium]|nr:amidohydrolase [Acidobacteriota bacterium]